jgi:hypothetical protein
MPSRHRPGMHEIHGLAGSDFRSEGSPSYAADSTCGFLRHWLCETAPGPKALEAKIAAPKAAIPSAWIHGSHCVCLQEISPSPAPRRPMR